MTKKEYLAKMAQHEIKFDELWQEIQRDTNRLIEDSGHLEMQSDYMIVHPIDRFADYIAKCGAWVRDRTSGKNPLTTRANVSSKIRKALGYYK